MLMIIAFISRMKTKPHTQILCLICAVILVCCASQTEPGSTAGSASLNTGKSASGQVIQAVNSYRLSQGKKPLQRHAGLDRLAQLHSEYLRKNRGSFKLYGSNVSHMGFDGRTAVARKQYQMENISENVAATNHPGMAIGAVIVQDWKGSKDHHQNMMDSWTHTGVGVVADSDGTVFVTQLFSTMASSQQSLRNRFNG